jgi:hypothetical protein
MCQINLIIHCFIRVASSLEQECQLKQYALVHTQLIFFQSMKMIELNRVSAKYLWFKITLQSTFLINLRQHITDY